MKSSARTSALVSLLREALSQKPLGAKSVTSGSSSAESSLTETFLAELPLFKPSATVTPMRRSNTKRVYQLKVTLQGSKPAIWRRLLVSGSASLGDLHDIIQVAMGWEREHLHGFRTLGRSRRRNLDEDLNLDDEDNLRVTEALPRAKSSMLYEYDFGDSWRHEIVVEKTFPSAKGMIVPSCIDRKRACPPEDCGGVWGYAELIEAVGDPKHPSHNDMIEWLGDGFDPERFDMKEVNEQMAGITRER